MRKAQGLVDRLHSRRLYRYCNEFLVPHGAASQPKYAGLSHCPQFIFGATLQLWVAHLCAQDKAKQEITPVPASLADCMSDLALASLVCSLSRPVPESQASLGALCS